MFLPIEKRFRTIIIVLAIVTATTISISALHGEEKAKAKATKVDNAPKVTWEKLFRVRTGSLPKGVVLNPDETEAWVTNFGHDRGKNITVFDAKTGKTKKQIYLKGRAVELAFSNDGKTAYVSNFDTGKLYAIDVETYEIRDSVYSGRNPKIVTLAPDGERVYVSNWTSRTVSVIDADTLELLGEAKVGSAPRGSDTDAAGKFLFVANFNGHNLSIVNAETMKETKKLKMGRHPRHVTATPDGKSILVSCMGKGSDTVFVIDPVTHEIVKQIKVARGPKAMAISPDSRYAFTANYFAHSVSIIDLAAGKVVGEIPDLGKSPCGMDMSKDGKILYLTSWKTNELWALKITYPE